MFLVCSGGSLLVVHRPPGGTDEVTSGWRVEVGDFDADSGDFSWADGFAIDAGAEPVAVACVLDESGLRVPAVALRRRTSALRWRYRVDELDVDGRQLVPLAESAQELPLAEESTP